MPNAVDPRNALAQYDFILDQIEQHTRPSSGRFVLTPELIRELHAISFGGHGTGDAGQFRTVEVAVNGSPHKPTSPAEIPREIDKLCEYVNKEWEDRGALHLAAFVLWKLNWIHPFVDGNGRTARALSYLVLGAKLGAILPGVPTIPEQLRYHRGRYFDALQAADNAFQEMGKVDVTDLEEMLHDMLIQQLGNVPGLPDDEQDRLRDIFDRRVQRVPGSVRLSHFGAEVVTERLWAINDHVVLQVGPLLAIQQAEDMHTSFGRPFPRLLAEAGGAALVHVREDQGGLVLRRPSYDATSGYAVSFDRNAAAVIEHPHVRWDDKKGPDTLTNWELCGALYVVRYGRNVTAERVSDVFELLLARHMSLAA